MKIDLTRPIREQVIIQGIMSELYKTNRLRFSLKGPSTGECIIHSSPIASWSFSGNQTLEVVVLEKSQPHMSTQVVGYFSGHTFVIRSKQEVHWRAREELYYFCRNQTHFKQMYDSLGLKAIIKKYSTKVKETKDIQAVSLNFQDQRRISRQAILYSIKKIGLHWDSSDLPWNKLKYNNTEFAHIYSLATSAKKYEGQNFVQEIQNFLGVGFNDFLEFGMAENNYSIKKLGVIHCNLEAIGLLDKRKSLRTMAKKILEKSET